MTEEVHVNVSVDPNGSGYAISVDPWRAHIKVGEMITWSCNHSLTVVLGPGPHSFGARFHPVLSGGKSLSTPPAVSHPNNDFNYILLIHVEEQDSMRTILVDPEYERRP